MAAIGSNRAAWIVAERANPLQVGQGPDQTKPGADEVIIQVAAVAINPSEPFTQSTGAIPLKYPHVLGSDIAGTIAKIGSGVTRFKVGDRVIGHCFGLLYGGPRHGAFQEFSACREQAVAKIPDSLPFQQAVVLPLSISTSATALFANLKLRLPTVEPTKTGDEVVLIWGGASSIGSSAIQLAVAAGYKVVTTASTKNHDYVKSLVPTSTKDVIVFDYADSNVGAKILSHIKDSGLKLVGTYDCISTKPTLGVIADVLGTLGGGTIVTVLMGLESPREDVQLDMVWAFSAAGSLLEGADKVWEQYVPQALEKGAFKAEPKAQVVGRGLEQIQDAIDLYKKGGVSATKLVVLL